MNQMILSEELFLIVADFKWDSPIRPRLLECAKLAKLLEQELAVHRLGEAGKVAKSLMEAEASNALIIGTVPFFAGDKVWDSEAIKALKLPPLMKTARLSDLTSGGGHEIANECKLADALALIHSHFLNFEIEGLWISAQEIREITHLLQLMQQTAVRQTNELMRLRYEAQLRQPRVISQKPNNVVAFPMPRPRPQPPRGGAA